MYYYIINPAAGYGKINKIQDKLKLTLTNFNIVGEFVKTTGPGDAIKLTKLGLSKGYNTIVAIGGDGTVNEVANVIAKEGSEKTVLGVIPIGNTNNLARTLGILSWESSCSILASRKLETIDLGQAAKDYFITLAGIGFDADIVKYRLETKFNIFLKLSYLKTLICKLYTFRPAEITLEFNENLSACTEVFTVLVINSKPYNPAIIRKVKANPQDGLLDVLVVSRLSKLKMLKYFTTIARGDYENLAFAGEQISIFHTKQVKITSEKPLSTHLDGKIIKDITKEPITIKAIPKKLKVIVGKERQF
jgi:YegS/Rv2252/BmrU family lipid kinase